MKEICIQCGMVANVDPAMHAERYAHDPVVIRNGERYQFDWSRYVFAPEAELREITGIE